ncbi:unnamed protein product [Urochloa humidicola]
MEETKQDPPPLHVVVFPWLAFGHIVPFLELAQQLAKRGHLVTFVSSPRNIARLPRVRELSPRIRLFPLPLPAVDGLPAGAESTADVPPQKVELLKVAFDGLASPFASFLASSSSSSSSAAAAGGHSKRPDWIILDFAHSWLPPIAEQHGVPCALFLIFPAPFVAFMGPMAANDAHPRTAPVDFAVPPPWLPPSSPAFRLHEARRLAAGFRRPNASGVSDIARFWDTERRCRMLLCRSSREVDGPAVIDLLRDLYGKPVLPSGLLAPYDAAIAAAAGGEDEEDSAAGIMRWLDAQPAGSVLYVAFGSEAPLSPSLVSEVALGLELAGVRFLWALREDAAGGMLPAGFASGGGAAEGRGMVVGGWVAQVWVLAHGAVGGFLTHAGWSSLVESFLFGHPLVMLPLFGDQGITARVMAERRAGVEVPREEEDGSVSREGVAEAVRKVMVVGEEREEFVRVAKELRRVLWDRETQEGYVDELIHNLLLQRHGE